jgi:hypothetical protein
VDRSPSGRLLPLGAGREIPVSMALAPDGTIYVSTFTSNWRIREK